MLIKKIIDTVKDSFSIEDEDKLKKIQELLVKYN